MADSNDSSDPATAHILREIEALRLQFTERIAGIMAMIDVRFKDIAKATALFEANLTRIPTDTDKQVGHLEDLNDEKFASIQTQFKERDTRVDQTAKDTKVAVDAALQAAEKAVNKQNESFAASIDKSEKATTKQIDQQAATLAVMAAGLDSKITDVKDRVTRLEGTAIGYVTAESKQSSRISTNQMSDSLKIGITAVIVTLLVGISGFFGHFIK